jgi:hypothetical protein
MLVALLGALFSILGQRVRETQREATAAERIRRSGGLIVSANVRNGSLNTLVDGVLPGTYNRSVVGVFFSARQGGQEIGLSPKRKLAIRAEARRDINDHVIRDIGSSLEEFRHLARLSLRDTQITDEGLRLIRLPDSVWFLDLGNTRLSDESIAFLSELSHLQVLRIDGTSITRSQVARLERKLPGCKVFY